jgi:hypothetical protein
MALKAEFVHYDRALYLGTRLKEHAMRFGLETKITGILARNDSDLALQWKAIEETARSLAYSANIAPGSLQQLISELDLIGLPERSSGYWRAL